MVFARKIWAMQKECSCRGRKILCTEMNSIAMVRVVLLSEQESIGEQNFPCHMLRTLLFRSGT